MKKEEGKEALELHKQKKGKIGICPKLRVKNSRDLALAYTPGVAHVAREIFLDKSKSFTYTDRGNSVAIVSDGSAVLGLGKLGPEAALPVMEGKALLFKELAGIDAHPLCISAHSPSSVISFARAIAPTFGGINLEDIKAPDCFFIEESLQELGIPVMHDDQHGTAVVVLAALTNALRIVNKRIEEVKIVINGAGAAGTAIAGILLERGADSSKMLVFDSKGVLYRGRPGLAQNIYKKRLAKRTNTALLRAPLAEALKGADVFIGTSVSGVLSAEMVNSMAPKAVVFALANPEPEIHPSAAKKAGAAVVATGRSDYPNQVNNALGFPGIFRGALDAKATRITRKMKIAAAEALASHVEPRPDQLLPSPLSKSAAKAVAEAVKRAWLEEKQEESPKEKQERAE